MCDTQEAPEAGSPFKNASKLWSESEESAAAAEAAQDANPSTHSAKGLRMQATAQTRLARKSLQLLEQAGRESHK